MANIKIADLNSPILEDLSDNDPQNIKGGSEVAQAAGVALVAAAVLAGALASSNSIAGSVQSAFQKLVGALN